MPEVWKKNLFELNACFNIISCKVFVLVFLRMGRYCAVKVDEVNRMTREKAIKELLCMKHIFIAESDADKALNMAIEALKEHESVAKSLNDAVELIHKLRKKNEWIPCSERLPKEEERVLVCSDKGDIEISMGCMFDSTGEFEWYTSGWKFGTVVAWMPLPEPFKGE